MKTANLNKDDRAACLETSAKCKMLKHKEPTINHLQMSVKVVKRKRLIKEDVQMREMEQL